MQTSVTISHLIWSVGDLQLLKKETETTAQPTWRATEFSLATTIWPDDHRVLTTWLLLFGYIPQEKQFHIGFRHKSGWETCPGMKFCYRFILSSGSNGTKIVDEVSGFIEHLGGRRIDFDMLPYWFSKIHSDRITEQNYVVRLWFDTFDDFDSRISTTGQIFDQAAAPLDKSALLARFQSTLPLVMAGLQSPYYDLVVEIGEGKKFYVHRMILAAHSPVFDTMLSGESWKEGKRGEIVLEHVDAKTVEDLLHFLYTEKLSDDFVSRTNQAVWNLIGMADKYRIENLKEKIEFFLTRKRCADQERYDQWVIAERYRMPKLKRVCELILSTKLSLFYGKPLPPTIGELNYKKTVALYQTFLKTGTTIQASSLGYVFGN